VASGGSRDETQGSWESGNVTIARPLTWIEVVRHRQCAGIDDGPIERQYSIESSPGRSDRWSSFLSSYF
jgi:hypothetical protein